jgi:small subunit ribosomal protein S20
MKRHRTDAAKRMRNRSKLSRLRTAMRRVREASTPEEREQAWRTAQSLLDRAGRTRLLHPNKVRRIKTSLGRS